MFSGSKEQIKKDVEWLLEDCRFIFGSVDIKASDGQFGREFTKIIHRIIPSTMELHSTLN